MALILDTSPLYASVDRNDANHAVCRQLIEASAEALVIPAPVLPELDYLVRTRLHGGIMLDVLMDIIEGAYDIEELRPEDYRRIQVLCTQYEGIGLVDAAVLAVVERLGERKLATLDRRHFGMLRPRHVEALRLLP
jgi:predicted nucleic acid-binding protein